MDPKTAQAPQQQTTQQPFPEELPPRKFHQTWWQRNRFNAKTFFTLHYHSFSPLHRPDKRDLWRRISMIVLLLARFLHLLLFYILFYSGLWASGGWIVFWIFLTLLGLLIFFIGAWNIALIGEAKGTRRACGMTLRRTFFDLFLHIMTIINIGISVTFFLWDFVGIILISVWLGLGIIILAVALMASAEPIDQYGIGGPGGV